MALEQLSEQEILRRNSLKALRDLGIEPYPAERFDVTATAAEIAEQFDANPERFAEVRIAGRMLSRRIMGSASFFELQDHTGRMQIYIRRDDICPEGDPTLYNTVFKKLLDIGDFIGIEGFAFRTNTGELSVPSAIAPSPVPTPRTGLLAARYSNSLPGRIALVSGSSRIGRISTDAFLCCMTALLWSI